MSVTAAFEQLGYIRERLTRLHDLAADLDDGEFSQQLQFALRANTAAMERANTLLSATRTEPAEPDLDSHQLDGLRGRRV